MRIAFVGNQDNNAYRLCKWVRQAGYDARLYMFRQERGPRSRPELVDPQLGEHGENYPSWIQPYDDTRDRLSLVLPSRLAKRIETDVDVVVTSGATGLLAARHFRKAPVVHLSLGSEIAEFPLLLWRWRVSPPWRAVAWLARRAIRHVRKIVEVYVRSLRTLDRLGQLDKVVLWGFPEDMQGNRSRVDAQMLAELTARYAPYQGVFLWLTRLNMADPNSTEYKAADRFLEAFEKVVHQHRFKVRAIVGRHGSDLEGFQRRVVEKGLADHVDYVDHLPYRQVLTYASVPNVTVFDVPDVEMGGTLGGVAREAVSVGAVVVEGLDEELMKLVFGEGCPVLNSPDAQGCYEAMVRLLTMTPAQRDQLRGEIARWASAHLDWPVRVEQFIAILRSVVYCHQVPAMMAAWSRRDPQAMARVVPKDAL